MRVCCSVSFSVRVFKSVYVLISVFVILCVYVSVRVHALSPHVHEEVTDLYKRLEHCNQHDHVLSVK